MRASSTWRWRWAGAMGALAHVAAEVGAQGAGAPLRDESDQKLGASITAPSLDIATGQGANRARTDSGRRVTLDLRDVTLRDALKEVVAQSDVTLLYGNNVVPLDQRVSVQVMNVSAAVALRAILRGTDVEVQEAAGKVMLVRRARRAGLDQAEETARQGAISGQVVDSKTGRPIAAVAIGLDGTTVRTTTDDSGQFRIAGVQNGTHTVSARRLGYARASQQATVADGREAFVAFVLEPLPGRLGEVVVTGTIAPTEVRALPTPISVLDAGDLQRGNIQRVDAIFRTEVPGGISWDQGVTGNTNSMTVRGANALSVGTNSMKIYVDGVEVSTDIFSTVDVNSIERIEVTRGPEASTIYGSGATGGVLQIFTKKGDRALSRPRINASVAGGTIQRNTGSGSVAQQEISASVLGGAPQFSYNIGGTYRREGEWAPEYFSEVPSLFAGGRVSQGPIAVELSARYRQHSFATVVPPALAASGATSYSRPAHENNDYRYQTLSLQLSYATTPAIDQRIIIGFDRTNADVYGTRPRHRSPSDTLLSLLQSSYQKPSARYNATLRLPTVGAVSTVLTAGAEWFAFQQDAVSTQGAVTTGPFVTLVPGGAPTISRVRGRNSGYFTQAQVSVSDAWFLTLGVRGERNRDFGADYGTAFSPRAGLAHSRTVGEIALKVRTSYGSALRPPPPGVSVGTPPFFVGNPDLGPERQTGGDVGLDVDFGDQGSLSATYYSQDAVDLIDYAVVDTAQGLPVRQGINVGRVRNSGVELEGSVRLGAARMRAQYTTMHSEVKRLSPSYSGDLRRGDQLLGIPRNTAALSVELPVHRRTNVTAQVLRIGNWTNYDWAAFLGGAPPRGSLRAYWMDYAAVTKANLSVTQTISDHLTAFVNVDNLTNNLRAEKDNLAVLSGRRVTVGLRAAY